MPRGTYIKDLQEENERLRQQLEGSKVIQPIKKEVGQDYLDKMTTIVYGPNRQNYRQEQITLGEAFVKLVEFYSSFGESTNRNVPKQWNDPNSGDGINVNSDTVYAKMTYIDRKQKQKIEVIRDMPLWLAVDNAVQQGKQVELISEEEFLSWYKQQQIKDRKSDNRYQNRLQDKQIDLAIEEELSNKAKE